MDAGVAAVEAAKDKDADDVRRLAATSVSFTMSSKILALTHAHQCPPLAVPNAAPSIT